MPTLDAPYPILQAGVWFAMNLIIRRLFRVLPIWDDDNHEFSRSSAGLHLILSWVSTGILFEYPLNLAHVPTFVPIILGFVCAICVAWMACIGTCARLWLVPTILGFEPTPLFAVETGTLDPPWPKPRRLTTKGYGGCGTCSRVNCVCGGILG